MRPSGPHVKPSLNVWVRVLLILALPTAMVLMGFTYFWMPCDYCRSRNTPRNACIANLKQIDGAKATWALECNKQPTDTPLSSDLFGETGYIRVRQFCPAGGAYTIGAVEEKPTCSIPDHTF